MQGGILIKEKRQSNTIYKYKYKYNINAGRTI